MAKLIIAVGESCALIERCVDARPKQLMLRIHRHRRRQPGELPSMIKLDEKQLSGNTLEQELHRTLDFWSRFEKFGHDAVTMLTDEHWIWCSQAAGHLSEQARLPINIVIAQAYADWDDLRATRPAAKTRKQLEDLKKSVREVHSGIDVAWKNLTAIFVLEHERDFIFEQLKNNKKLEAILDTAIASIGKSKANKDVRAERLLIARLQLVLSRFERNMSTANRDPVTGVRTDWYTFLKAVLDAAALSWSDKRATTRLREAAKFQVPTELSRRIRDL